MASCWNQNIAIVLILHSPIVSAYEFVTYEYKSKENETGCKENDDSLLN